MFIVCDSIESQYGKNNMQLTLITLFYIFKNTYHLRFSQMKADKEPKKISLQMGFLSPK